MYEKTEWKARKGVKLNRFEKSEETSRSVVLENSPIAITEPGTPYSIANMNKIEQGIYGAHEGIAQEGQARSEAMQTHNASATAHADIRGILNSLAGLPGWDPDKHILTFKAQDGSTLTVDLPLEALAKDIDFDPATKEIILIKHDGSQIRVSVASLVDVYTGSLGTHIQVTIGANNQINAVLRAGSITENELAAALLNTLVRTSEKGVSNGVATLDQNGTIPANQLPSSGGLFAVFTDSSLQGNGTPSNPLAAASMINKFVSKTHAELLAMIANKQLTPGYLYQITDYQTVYKQPATNLDSSQTAALNTPVEPLIVRATSGNTLDVKAYSPNFPQDEIWYDAAKNNTARFAWASPNDKGQIFRRITKNGNDFPYDVRNIRFRRWELDFSAYPVLQYNTPYPAGTIGVMDNMLFKAVRDVGQYWDSADLNNLFIFLAHRFNGLSSSGTHSIYGSTNMGIPILSTYKDYYTFDSGTGTLIDDAAVYKNVMGVCKNNNNVLELNNCVFIGGSCFGNTFGNGTQYNTFGNGTQNNTFGNGTQYNTFGNYTLYNTFGNYTRYNTFGNYTQYNTFGNYTWYNTFGNYTGHTSYRNTFGDEFQSNTLGNYICGNTIGNYFQYNRFGDRFYSQTMVYPNATSAATAVRYNEFKNGFTRARNWGTNQDSLLRSDESVDWRQANGSNAVMYFYQNSAGAAQTGAIAAA